MVRTSFITAAVTMVFVAPTLPVFAANAAPQSVEITSLSQTLMQAELDRCIAAGTITIEQVQSMTDDQLVAALDQCSKLASAAATPQVVSQPAPVVVEQSQPVVMSQPLIIRRPPIVVDQGSDPAGGGTNIDVGGIANGRDSAINEAPPNGGQVPGMPNFQRNMLRLRGLKLPTTFAGSTSNTLNRSSLSQRLSKTIAPPTSHSFSQHYLTQKVAGSATSHKSVFAGLGHRLLFH